MMPRESIEAVHFGKNRVAEARRDFVAGEIGNTATQ